VTFDTSLIAGATDPLPPGLTVAVALTVALTKAVAQTVAVAVAQTVAVAVALTKAGAAAMRSGARSSIGLLPNSVPGQAAPDLDTNQTPAVAALPPTPTAGAAQRRGPNRPGR
jgi:hypothetical protein